MKDIVIPLKPNKSDGVIKEAEWRQQWKLYNDQFSAIQADHKVRLLLKWFKEDFFQWINSPECSICKVLPFCHFLTWQGETKHVGVVPATEEEERYTARNVELWQCSKCCRNERFPRYNDPIKLLSTRRGRCGEFANVFPFLNFG
jgi:peptide-N4-(N-acetyl-beta-glucosaminyl)asparagine amidase